MNETNNPDLNRMILSIEQDVNTKIRELKIKSIETYNSIKSNIIKEKKEEIDDMMEKKLKQLHIERQLEGNKLKMKYKNEYLLKRQELLDVIFLRVEEKLKETRLSKDLFNRLVERVDRKMLNNFYIICREKDKNIVTEVLPSEVEIKEMPEIGLGGIVLFSKDGRRSLDNSYRTRLACFKRTQMDFLFKKFLQSPNSGSIINR